LHDEIKQSLISLFISYISVTAVWDTAGILILFSSYILTDWSKAQRKGKPASNTQARNLASA